MSICMSCPCSDSNWREKTHIYKKIKLWNKTSLFTDGSNKCEVHFWQRVLWAQKRARAKTHLGLNQMEVDLTYKLRSEEYMYVLPFRTAVLKIGLGNSGEILDHFGGSLWGQIYSHNNIKTLFTFSSLILSHIYRELFRGYNDMWWHHYSDSEGNMPCVLQSL